MIRKNWTKEETIIAFNVYCKIPFKNSSKSNPIIIKYAELIGRSPSALNMKIGNFGRLDPELRKQGITGLSHGSKLEQEVWDEFNGDWGKLALESELLIAKLSNNYIEELDDLSKSDNNIPLGLDKEYLIKQRINQNFFRTAILSSYNTTCCITGISIDTMLNASHIVPWAIDPKNRLNPRNGLCLNSFHDRAFDRGLITITPDFKVKISSSVQKRKREASIRDYFFKYNDTKIILPDKFLPSKEFLYYHNKEIFIG